MTKHKHLTLSDRNDIQLGLERGETFKAIGQSILKDPTTVSKEVKRNRQVREIYFFIIKTTHSIWNEWTPSMSVSLVFMCKHIHILFNDSIMLSLKGLIHI